MRFLYRKFNDLHLETDDQVTIVGGGNTVTVGGSAKITAQSGDQTFAFASAAATATVTGYDTTDTLRFDASQFAGWQDFLAHASQQGTDTVIETDSAHSITLAGVTLATLDQNHVAFA